MKTTWALRWDDVYFGGVDKQGDPWFVPRDESQRFDSAEQAKIALEIARAVVRFRKPCCVDEVRIVRLTRKPKGAK